MICSAVVNGINFLISPSSVLLLLYRNETDFSALILYPTALLNSCMSSSNLGVESSEFSMYSIIVSCLCEEGEFDFFFANLNAFNVFLLPDC